MPCKVNPALSIYFKGVWGRRVPTSHSLMPSTHSLVSPTYYLLNTYIPTFPSLKQVPLPQCPVTMASCTTTFYWECPKFNFNSPQQSEDCRVFYIRATDYLKALDIDTEEADNCKTRWKQLKIIFKGEDWQTLQTLINNGTRTQENQKMPWQVLDAIGKTIKSEDHFWHFQDELLLDVHQLPSEVIHA